MGRNLKSVGVFCEFEMSGFSLTVLPSEMCIHVFLCVALEASVFPLIVLPSKNDVCFLLCVFVCSCSVPWGLLQMELWLQSMFSIRAALF